MKSVKSLMLAMVLGVVLAGCATKTTEVPEAPEAPEVIEVPAAVETNVIIEDSEVEDAMMEESTDSDMESDVEAMEETE